MKMNVLFVGKEQHFYSVRYVSILQGSFSACKALNLTFVSQSGNGEKEVCWDLVKVSHNKSKNMMNYLYEEIY